MTICTVNFVLDFFRRDVHTRPLTIPLFLQCKITVFLSSINLVRVIINVWSVVCLILGFSVSSCTKTNPRLSVAKVRVLSDKYAAAAGPATSHRRRVKTLHGGSGKGFELSTLYVDN